MVIGGLEIIAPPENHELRINAKFPLRIRFSAHNDSAPRRKAHG
jgi:hypothetical protein